MYKIEIPNVTNIATCQNLKEVYNALLDSQCMSNGTIHSVLEIADSLIEHGSYVGTVAYDKRYSYVIKKI